MLNQILVNCITPIFYKVLYLTIIGSIAGLIVCVLRNAFDKKLSGKWRCIMWFVVLAALLIPIRYEIKTSHEMPNNIINNIENIKNIADKQIVYHELQNEQFENQYQLSEQESVSKDIPIIKNMQENLNEKKETNILTSNEIDRQNNNNLPINYIFTNIVIPSVWLFGALIFASLLVSGVFQIRKKSKKANFQDERISLILENCKKQLNINKNIKIVLQENSKTSIFGIFNPVILISENILTENDETIKYIFLHELSHYKRKDPIFNYALLATLSIHWFNPIVWFIFMKVREDIELGADELAIKKLNKQEKKEYGLVLINLLQNVSRVNYTANMLCISDTEKNMERRILMIKGKNKSRILSAIIVIAIIGVIACIVFVKTEKVDIDVNAGLVSNLDEENYEKIWSEPQKFGSYQEYIDYANKLYAERYTDIMGEITEEEKGKLIPESTAREKITNVLENLGRSEEITDLQLHKQYLDLAQFNYTASLGKNVNMDIDAETGNFLDFYDDAIVVKQLKEDKLTFNEAKDKAIEIYNNMNFLSSKYGIYSVREMTHSWGAGTLDKSGIQYENQRWEATFYEISDSNVLNKYQQLLIQFFVSDGNVYIVLVKEMNMQNVNVTLGNANIQENPVLITEEKAVEIAKEMDKKIEGRDIETTRTILVNNEVNEYVWIQEKSHGQDTGIVTETEAKNSAENESSNNPELITTAQTHSYNQYYYPEKIIRNTYEVTIDYSGERVIDENTPYTSNGHNGSFGRIYYVDCTTGEIIGGRNYGYNELNIEGEYMENGESRMTTKNIFFDITTGEKVAEQNYNYSQEIIDNFMKNN